MKKSKKSAFEKFRSRMTPEAVKKKLEGGKSDYDALFKSEYKVFSPNELGDYRIRILPPTWESEDDEDGLTYAYTVYVHYGIGPDDARYFCLNKMKNQPCPICEEYQRARRAGDEEYAKKLRPTTRALVWLIDRANEEDGPMLWAMPWSVDQEIARRVYDDVTKELLPIDDPFEGYDIMFSREGPSGKPQYMKYVGVDIARRPSPLFRNEEDIEAVAEYIIENPLPQTMIFYSYDHIKSVFDGGIEQQEQ